MIDLLIDMGVVAKDEIDIAKQCKREKLSVWSNIFRSD